jgi:hypothetical protein
MFIFNLDRFIISTLRKKEIDPNLSLSEKLRQKSGEILAAIPRLLFAIVISMVISTPLELKYFEPEIRAKMSKTNLNATIDIEQQLNADFPEIARLQKANENLEADLKKKAAQCEQLRVESNGEAEGKLGTGKLGKGPVFREKQQQYDECKTALEKMEKFTQTKLAENNEELKRWQRQRDSKAASLKQNQEASDGFLAQLIALHELSSGPGPVGWVSLFITWLFILLETTPLFMKLLSKRGPYDYHLDRQEYESYVAQLKAVSDLNMKTNAEVEFDKWKMEAEIEKKKEMTKAAMDDIDNLAQAEIEAAKAEVAKEVVERWKKNSLTKAATLIAPQTQVTPQTQAAGV